jgi:hypothetical protein
MSSISNLVLVQLAGEVPPQLNLPELHTLEASCASVSKTLAPFLADQTPVTNIEREEDFPLIKPTAGLAVVYLVGHAWLEGQEYRTSIRAEGGSRILAGRELAEMLVSFVSESAQLLILIDTCNAAALIREFKDLLANTTTCAIAASSEGESTLEYPLDRTTRFAEALAASIRKSSDSVVDAVELATSIRKRLSRPGIMPAQAASYWVSGEPIRLEPQSPRSDKGAKYSRTHLVFRSLLIATGVFLATLAVWTFIYYRNHVLVTLELPEFSQIADAAAIEIHEEFPERNESTKILEFGVLGVRRSQIRLPASDLLVITKAQYKDGHDREIRFPINLSPGLAWSAKSLTIIWPSSDVIGAHPRMAYVPPVEWQQGTDRQMLKSDKAFWIDLYPVSVHEYRPFAIEAERTGDIQYSVLIDGERNAAAVDAVGLKQVPKLMDDLNQVFNVVNASQRAENGTRPAKSDDSSTGKTQLSAATTCEDCPAPLTIEEAQLFCSRQGKRVPTDLEWELAARGVDGRLYPWGNKFDSKLTNCVGLSEKGAAPATLEPSSKYLQGASPFGVIDMVGNAGDWVDTRGGYERTFMGGFYAFNPEECMVFKSLPDTGEPPWRKITTRCVQE